jgi:hypothetical protein
MELRLQTVAFVLLQVQGTHPHSHIVASGFKGVNDYLSPSSLIFPLRHSIRKAKPKSPRKLPCPDHPDATLAFRNFGSGNHSSALLISQLLRHCSASIKSCSRHR